MNLKGKLIVKNETKEYGSNGFTKREFVIETEDSQYPQQILIELIKDKCSLLDKYKIGDLLDVSININGRSWTNPQGEVKYFNSIQGWKIDTAQVEAQDTAPKPNNNPVEIIGEDEDLLPF